MNSQKSKTKDLLTPRGYISWSQLNLWESSKKKYIEHYFYGEPSFTSKEMRLGSLVAEAKEAGGSKDPTIDFLVHALEEYDIIEAELTADLPLPEGKVKLLGKLDTKKKRIHDFIEYKTGKVPWTQARADKSGQITFYYCLTWLKYNKMPKNPAKLIWAQTEDKEDTELGVGVTGRIEEFVTTRNMTDIMQMLDRIRKATLEINEAYSRELGV